jgi:hypothetical protein
VHSSRCAATTRDLLASRPALDRENLVIELVLTCFVGSFVGGFVIANWIGRSMSLRPVPIARREV